jgi:hypothetical protein
MSVMSNLVVEVLELETSGETLVNIAEKLDIPVELVIEILETYGNEEE